MARTYTINVQRPPIIKGDFAIVPLTDGHEAIIDLADVPFVGRWNWYNMTLNGTHFAVRRATINGKRRHLRMHRALLNPPQHMIVLHIDGDTLNNRRSNLRLMTQRENALMNVRGKR